MSVEWTVVVVISETVFFFWSIRGKLSDLNIRSAFVASKQKGLTYLDFLEHKSKLYSKV
jgi:hypothetical protein